MAHQLSYCGEQVRARDRDRFLCSLFAPAEVREALWALFAFNHEIAKTREVVSETQLGLIRLQWWRDVMAGIYAGDEIPAHEVVVPLAAAIRQYDLPHELFETLIYAREFDLEDVPPGNIEGLIHYADFTTTPLMRLVMRVTGANDNFEPVRQVAVNYALVGLLRAAPFHARQGRVMWPADLMEKYKVRADKLESGENLRALVREVSGQFIEGLKPEDQFLRASQGLARLYLKQIEKAGYDTLSPKLNKPPAFREMRLYAGVKLHNLWLKN